MRQSISGPSSRINAARERLDLTGRSSAIRKGQVALGVVWCIDGLLKLQPYFFHHFASGVIDVSAQGQPGLISHPITWLGSLVRPHQTIFVLAAVLAECSIGIGLLVRRTVKPALIASIVWALNVWLTGEGLGFLFTGATPRPLIGILGTAPMYVLVSLVVWPRSARDGASPRFGLLGERGVRLVWAALWLSAAALWLFPANAAAGALGSAITSAPSGAGWLASLQSAAAKSLGGSDATVALVLALASAEIGFSVLWRRSIRIALFGAIGLSLLFWLLGEGMGGLLTGQATDVGNGPLMILLAALLLRLAPERAPTAAAATVRPLALPGREPSGT